jgi:dihydrofolate reductase
MRNVFVTEFISVDGVIDTPSWTTPYFNEEIGKFKNSELFACDAMLLGRVTYQGFAAAWPSRTDEDGFADRMNNLPKFVASRTLSELSWNATLLGENIADEVSILKQQPGQDIMVAGSADFIQTLMQHDLIDEYRLLVFPVVVGSGKRLFNSENTSLKLVDTKTFPLGVVLLTYRIDRA